MMTIAAGILDTKLHELAIAVITLEIEGKYFCGCLGWQNFWEVCARARVVANRKSKKQSPLNSRIINSLSLYTINFFMFMGIDVVPNILVPIPKHNKKPKFNWKLKVSFVNKEIVEIKLHAHL